MRRIPSRTTREAQKPRPPNYRPVRRPHRLRIDSAALDPDLLALFAGRRCLVTGGLGFIGSNLARALAEAGAEVVVVDALVARHGGNRRNLEGASRPIEVIEADIGDRGAVGPALVGIDVIFNLAGQVSHVDSMADPLFDLDVNTRSHFAFLELVREFVPECRIIYSSTRQIFGSPLYLPVDEEHPVAPVDVNGITKYATEQLHLLYGDMYGLRPTAIRLTNVFGPRQRLRGDHQGFLPIFIRRAIEGTSLRVFGEGEQERDCLYVDDAVACLLLAAVSRDAPGEILNVGNDERLSVRAIAEAVVAAAGSGEVEQVPWPPDRDAIDIGSYFGDSSKAKRLLGWEPWVPFRSGIQRTIEFYRAHRSWYL
jgi:UDP-glucose 4-epimerase